MSGALTVTDRWVTFWVILGLAVTGLAITLDWMRVSLQPRGAHALTDLPRPGERDEWHSPPPDSECSIAPRSGPGQPGWGEDDAATLAWARSLPRWQDSDPCQCDGPFDGAPGFYHRDWCPQYPSGGKPDDTLHGTAVIDYDAPLPAEFIPAVPGSAGEFITLNGTITPDLPRPGSSGGRAAKDPRSGDHAGGFPAGPGQPDDTIADIGNQPRAGAPAWGYTPDWAWNGQAFVRQTPTGLAWLDALCTAPLRALEAAR